MANSTVGSSTISRREVARTPQRSGDEGIQYSDLEVTFRKEFTLGSSEQVFAAGVYTVENAETRHYAGDHTAHVHRATMLIVPTKSGSRAIPIKSRI
jgi:hypothetical protein